MYVLYWLRIFRNMICVKDVKTKIYHTIKHYSSHVSY